MKFLISTIIDGKSGPKEMDFIDKVDVLKYEHAPASQHNPVVSSFMVKNPIDGRVYYISPSDVIKAYETGIDPTLHQMD